ncbi:MAG: ComEC/Rec2 family competence protein [Holophagaceae bacterium]|nr:ComEC/Rec2 family competence protein [Holophagaceae bacterium]
MLSRESLWRRIGSPDAWALPWALAAACTVPWLLPETWNGRIPTGLQAAAWCAVLLSAPLLRTRWAVVPLALALTWGTMGHLAFRARWEQALPTGLIRLEGVVADPWTIVGQRREGRLRLSAPGAMAGLDLPVFVPLEGEPGPAPGTPVALRGELRAQDPAPVFLPERPLWRARSDGAPRRVHLASALELEVLGPPEPSLPVAWKAWVRGRFDALPLPPGPARDLWGALALGLPVVDEDALTPFAESGTLHLLVVSGLQVTLVIAAIELLARRILRRRPRLAALAAALGGLAYALAVGFSAPVWRGLLMGLAWILGRSEGWRLPPALTLHGALLIWLLGHPAAGCEPGFLLAWWALLGLLWAAEPLAGLLAPLLGPAADPAARLIAPWLSTLPLVALFFGGVPVWGVLANLVVLPIVSAFTPLCLLLTLLPVPWITGSLGQLLAWTGTVLMPRFSGIRPLCTAGLAPWLSLALAWPALAHLHARLRRTRGLLLAVLALSAWLVAARGTGRPPGTLGLEAIDVGQGDALLLRAPDGAATLVDTGPGPWAARRIVKVLSRRGVQEPLHLVVTHPHADHAGGWATLARLWPLASATVPELREAASTWAPFAPQGLPRDAIRRGAAWNRGEVAFRALWPPGALDPAALGDANMVSLVLRVEWRDRQLWFMGDALGVQERDLLALGEPGAFPGLRLLKVGHHGSRSSSDPAWIAALRPSVSLVTAGRRNRFGHPHPETSATFSAAGLPVPLEAGPRFGLRLLAVPGGWDLEGGDGGRESLRAPARPAPGVAR